MRDTETVSRVESLCGDIHVLCDLAQKAKAIKDIKKDLYLGVSIREDDEVMFGDGLFDVAHSRLSEISSILEELINYIKTV